MSPAAPTLHTTNVLPAAEMCVAGTASGSVINSCAETVLRKEPNRNDSTPSYYRVFLMHVKREC